MPALSAPDYDAGCSGVLRWPFADWSGKLPNSTDTLERIHLPFQGSDVKTFFQHIWHGLPKYLPWMCLAIVAILAIFLVVFYGSLLLLHCVGFTIVGPAAGVPCLLQARFLEASMCTYTDMHSCRFNCGCTAGCCLHTYRRRVSLRHGTSCCYGVVGGCGSRSSRILSANHLDCLGHPLLGRLQTLRTCSVSVYRRKHLSHCLQKS